MKPIIALLVVVACSCSKSQDAEHARNSYWQLTPPPTAEEMSHYRIVQNEAKTAYAVQSTNTCWLNEHGWFQNGNTWNTLVECTNDIHEDVRAWRTRKNPTAWNPITTNSVTEYRLPKDIQDRFDEIDRNMENDSKKHLERIKQTAEAFYKKGFRDAEMMKESGQWQDMDIQKRLDKAWGFYAEKIDAIKLEKQ